MKKYINIIKDYMKINLNEKVRVNAEGGTSDARFIYKYTSVIEVGLLNHQAHKNNEYTTIKDLKNLFNIYKQILSL